MSLPTATKTRVGALRQYPTDLGIVPIVAVLSYLLAAATDPGSSIRLLVALPLILFLPGYAFVSVLFPAAAQAARQTGNSERDRPSGIDTVERLSLSLPLSLALISMIAIIVAPTDWGLSTAAVGISIVGFTVLCSQLAVVRRLRLSEGERYTPTFNGAVTRVLGTPEDGMMATASSLVLAVAIIGAALALTVGLVAPPATGGFTEFGIYTQEDDELVAGEYPDRIEPGEIAPIVISIENHEGQLEHYTVVVQEERFDPEGEPLERNELQRMEANVSDGGQVSPERHIIPTVEEETVRVSFLLYKGEPPAAPTQDNADQHLYLWMTVTEDESITLGEEVDDDTDAADGIETADGVEGATEDGAEGLGEGGAEEAEDDAEAGAEDDTGPFGGLFDDAGGGDEEETDGL